MLVNFMLGTTARRRLMRGSDTAKNPSECSSPAIFALQTKLDPSDIGL
jgi:hypothetical protein